jgi:hypothetical protein
MDAGPARGYDDGSVVCVDMNRSRCPGPGVVLGTNAGGAPGADARVLVSVKDSRDRMDDSVPGDHEQAPGNDDRNPSGAEHRIELGLPRDPLKVDSVGPVRAHRSASLGSRRRFRSHRLRGV